MKKIAISLFHKRVILLVALIIGLIGFTGKANAFSTFYPNPPSNFIPDGQRIILATCDLKNPVQSPAFVYWLSIAGNPVATSIAVAEGTPSIQLQLNWSGAVCSNRSAVSQTHLLVTSATPGTDAVFRDLVLNFNGPGGAFGKYNQVGTYRNSSFQFTYAPPGGINAGNTAVNVYPKVINNFFSSPLYRCVGGGGANGAVSSFSDFGPCTEKTPAIPIDITVIPKPQGSINTRKLVGGQVASAGTLPGNAKIDISANNSFTSLFSSTANPYNQGGINPGNYQVQISNYPGWRVKNATLNGANIPISCLPNNEGICNAQNINIAAGSTANIDWNLEELPKTNISCTNGSVSGTVSESPVKFDYGNGTIETVNGSISGNVYNINNYVLPDNLHDGANPPRTLVVKNGAGTAELQRIVLDPVTCVPPWYYPWLQTKNGDVISSGGIKGQPSGDGLLGSRKNSDKEASYLVMAAKPSNSVNGPFCSVYNYILTNVAATTNTECKNGTGYALNTFNLGLDASDNVIAGVEKAYNELPDACKSTSLPTSITVDSNACPKGMIYKVTTSSTISNLTVAKGRATIWVNGDLTLSGTTPVAYSSVNSTNPLDQPNLALVAKGNVSIFSNVSNLNSLVYSTGTINTCQAGAPTSCTNKLTVNGSLVAKNGFTFSRTYKDVTQRDAAEVVSLNPISILFPPPGISNEYFQGYAASAQTDSAEYQPRF
jgi:hypothetical protein